MLSPASPASTTCRHSSVTDSCLKGLDDSFLYSFSFKSKHFHAWTRYIKQPLVDFFFLIVWEKKKKKRIYLHHWKIRVSDLKLGHSYFVWFSRKISGDFSSLLTTPFSRFTEKAAKILLPLLLAFKLKAAALIPLALGAIALIAGKALIIGKIALVLAAIIGLKKLLHHQKSVTYEIVSHPHHTSSHTSHEGWAGGDYGSSGSGGHGGWGRSTNEAQNMAYRAYQPQQ